MEIRSSPISHFGIALIRADTAAGYTIVMPISTASSQRISRAAVLALLHEDVFILSLPPDSWVLRDAGCRYLLRPEPWQDAELHGFSLVQQITQSNIWIYERREQRNF